MSDFITPVSSLPIKIGQGSKRPGCEKGVANVLNGSLHPSLLVSAGGSAWVQCKMVMAAEFDQPRVKTYGITLPVQNGRAKVVVNNDPGSSAPVLKRADMASKKVFQCLIEEKLEIAGARIRERKDKTGQAPARAADLDFTEMRPIDLGLLARERVQPKEYFGFSGPQAGNNTAKGNEAALVSALTQHLVNSSGTESRVGSKGSLDKADVWIRQGCAQDTRPIETIRFQRVAHCVRMNAQVYGNGPNLPMLDIEKSPNLRNCFRRNHRSSPRTEWLDKKT